MGGKGAKDLTVAAIAGARYAVVSRGQLMQLGLASGEIDRRVAIGRLHVVHRGVYAVGHRVLTAEGRWMAAVLACGRNAVLSHATAAAAWEFGTIGSGRIHVTVPGDPGRKRRRASASIEAERSSRATRRRTATSPSRRPSAPCSTSPRP
jgi:hypothetical protein